MHTYIHTFIYKYIYTNNANNENNNNNNNDTCTPQVERFVVLLTMRCLLCQLYWLSVSVVVFVFRRRRSTPSWSHETCILAGQPLEHLYCAALPIKRKVPGPPNPFNIFCE